MPSTRKPNRNPRRIPAPPLAHCCPRLFCLLPLLLLLAALPLPCQGQEDGPRLHISLVYTVVAQDEALLVRLHVSSDSGAYNIYAHPKYDVAPFVGTKLYWQARIQTPSGRAVEEYRSMFPLFKTPLDNDFFNVTPRSSFRTVLPLRHSPLFSPEILPWPEFGEYTLSLRYCYRHQESFLYGDHLWQGCFTSNTVTFHVVGDIP